MTRELVINSFLEWNHRDALIELFPQLENCIYEKKCSYYYNGYNEKVELTAEKLDRLTKEFNEVILYTECIELIVK